MSVCQVDVGADVRDYDGTACRSLPLLEVCTESAKRREKSVAKGEKRHGRRVSVVAPAVLFRSQEFPSFAAAQPWA